MREITTTTINDLVDAHNNSLEGRQWIKAKIANLEDRTQCNNLKLWGTPESVQSGKLKSYATDMFSTLLPEATPLDLTIDRIHSLPKPPHQNFHIKEQCLAMSKSL